MSARRIPTPGALLVCVGLALGGCTFLEPTPTRTPSPTASVIDPAQLIGGVIDPAGTVWSGRDSGGDDTTITLHEDHTVSVRYGANSYDYAGDTWRVDHGVLYIEIYLNSAHGTAEYVGTWDRQEGVLEASLRTTTSARQLTVTLSQQ